MYDICDSSYDSYWLLIKEIVTYNITSLYEVSYNSNLKTLHSMRQNLYRFNLVKPCKY